MACKSLASGTIGSGQSVSIAGHRRAHRDDGRLGELRRARTGDADRLQLQPAVGRVGRLGDVDGAPGQLPRPQQDDAALDVRGARHHDRQPGCRWETTRSRRAGSGPSPRSPSRRPLARYFSGGTLQIRYGTTSNADASNVDQLLITAVRGGGAGAAGGNRLGRPRRLQRRQRLGGRLRIDRRAAGSLSTRGRVLVREPDLVETWASASRRPRCRTCARSPPSARTSATGPRRTPSRTASPSTSARPAA